MSETKQKQIEHVDSDAQQIAAVYAKSLLGVASKAGNEMVVVEELTSYVSEIFEKMPRLKSSLCSPRVSFENKEDLIDKSTKGASREFVNFLKITAQNGRLEFLSNIAAETKRLFSSEMGRVTAHVTTAVSVDAATESEIKKRLGSLLGKEVELEMDLDPEIMGGLIVRVGDTVYDGSLATQLSGAQTEILGKTTAKLSLMMDKVVSEN